MNNKPENIAIQNYTPPPNNATVSAFSADKVFLDYDGKRWALVGRGRGGWDWDNNGRHKDLVTQGLGTSAAFEPAYYDYYEVNNLARQGEPVEVLLKRASDNDGSRYEYATWLYEAGQLFDWKFDTRPAQVTYTIIDSAKSEYNGAVKTGANTRDAFMSDDISRIWTVPSDDRPTGFTMGEEDGGLFGENSHFHILIKEGFLLTVVHPVPYTEVYVRVPPLVPSLSVEVVDARSNGPYQVWEFPSQADYDACDLSNATLLPYENGKVGPFLFGGGTRYFGGGHPYCQQGQRVFFYEVEYPGSNFEVSTWGERPWSYNEAGYGINANATIAFDFEQYDDTGYISYNVTSNLDGTAEAQLMKADDTAVGAPKVQAIVANVASSFLFDFLEIGVAYKVRVRVEPTSNAYETIEQTSQPMTVQSPVDLSVESITILKQTSTQVDDDIFTEVSFKIELNAKGAADIEVQDQEDNVVASFTDVQCFPESETLIAEGLSPGGTYDIVVTQTKVLGVLVSGAGRVENNGQYFRAPQYDVSGFKISNYERLNDPSNRLEFQAGANPTQWVFGTPGTATWYLNRTPDFSLPPRENWAKASGDNPPPVLDYIIEPDSELASNFDVRFTALEALAVEFLGATPSVNTAVVTVITNRPCTITYDVLEKDQIGKMVSTVGNSATVPLIFLTPDTTYTFVITKLEGTDPDESVSTPLRSIEFTTQPDNTVPAVISPYPLTYRIEHECKEGYVFVELLNFVFSKTTIAMIQAASLENLYVRIDGIDAANKIKTSTGDELADTTIIGCLQEPNYTLATRGARHLIATKSKAIFDITMRVETFDGVDLGTLIASVDINAQLRVY